MVSLRREAEFSSGEGSFTHNDSLRERIIKVNEEAFVFKPFRAYSMSLHILVLLLLLIVGIVLIINWPTRFEKCEPYFVLVYGHAVYWCISLIVHSDLQARHISLRRNGYLEMHKTVNSHYKWPFYITSFWNAMILILGTIFHQVYVDFENECKSLAPQRYMCVLIAFENIIIIPIAATYLKKIFLFNKNQSLPDVMQDNWPSSVPGHPSVKMSVGYQNCMEVIEDLLDKQADMISFLKIQNAHLKQKIISMQSQNGDQRPEF